MHGPPGAVRSLCRRKRALERRISALSNPEENLAQALDFSSVDARLCRALCERCANSLAGSARRGLYRCDDRSEHRCRQGRRVRALPGVKDRGARARGLLPDPGRGAGPGSRPVAGEPTRSRGSGSSGGPIEGPDFIALMEGATPDAAGGFARRRRRRPWRRDRPDVQRTEVRLGLWALGDRWQRERWSRRTPRRSSRPIDHLRDGARRASPLRRAGRGGARQGGGGRRVPPHHLPRGLRGRRPTRSCTAMSSSRARSARTARSSRSRPGRSSAPHGSSAPTTARRSPTSSAAGYAIERGTGKHGRYFEIAGCAARAVRCLLRPQPRGRPGRGALPRH